MRTLVKSRRAISPVIATIILIAITIVIAIAVAGWVFGLFGSYSRTGSVTVLASVSSCSASSHQCVVVLSNQGATAVAVVSASVNGNTVTPTFPTTTTNSVVSVGGTLSVTVPLSTTIVAGQTVQIQIGLSNGATVSTTLVVSS